MPESKDPNIITSINDLKQQILKRAKPGTRFVVMDLASGGMVPISPDAKTLCDVFAGMFGVLTKPVQGKGKDVQN